MQLVLTFPRLLAFVTIILVLLAAAVDITRAQDDEEDLSACDEETDVFFSCIVDAGGNAQSCNSCMIAILEGMTDEIVGTRCSELEQFFCGVGDMCPDCDGCTQEADERFACALRDVACPFFQCPSTASSTMAPTLTPSMIPTPAPSTATPTEGNVCISESETMETCLQTRISASEGQECSRCTELAFPANPVGCFDLRGNSGVCENTNRCQESCGDCYELSVQWLSCRAETTFPSCSLDCSAAEEPPGGGGGSGVSVAGLAGIVAAAVVASLLLGVFILFRKKKSAPDGKTKTQSLRHDIFDINDDNSTGSRNRNSRVSYLADQPQQAASEPMPSDEIPQAEVLYDYAQAAASTSTDVSKRVAGRRVQRNNLTRHRDRNDDADPSATPIRVEGNVNCDSDDDSIAM